MSTAADIDEGLDLQIARLRADFPILSRTVNGKPLVYFDNAASSQVPVQVIDAISHYYRHEHANVHRGIHALSEEATAMYEGTRAKVASFVNAASPDEIIFTGGTTDGINLVAHSFGDAFVSEGDEILISEMEHHSNIVPWQMLCERTGAHLRVAPVLDNGEIDMEAFEAMLSHRTKLVSVVHTSNALGTVNPVERIVALAHAKGVPVLLDGAQAIGHRHIDVQALDCDFFACSGHKMHAATGIGFLYGKRRLLEAMPPFKGGGDMISTVTFEKTTYNDLPYKFEAGTPHIMGVKSLGAAIDYLESVGFDTIARIEHRLLEKLTDSLQAVEGIRNVGTSPNKNAVVSFVSDHAHPSDIGTLLDMEGIAVRVGHHCAQPLMGCFKIPGTVRASLAFYNTPEEIDRMACSLRRVLKML